MKSQILRTDEVRALVETGECEIVRDVKPQPCAKGYDPQYIDGRWEWMADEDPDFLDISAYVQVCPLGAPGELRYARETWACVHYECPEDFGTALYKATCDFDPKDEGWTTEDGEPFMWQSPVTMPRWASRLIIESTGVKVEQRDGIWQWVAKFKRVESEAANERV